MTCIFCEILAGREPASMVYQGPLCSAFMSLHTINPGHLLVVPNKHATDMRDLPSETGAALFQVAQRLANALRRSELRCEGVNLFLADGEAAGQEVFHLHLHVFPRYTGDGFGLTFGPQHLVLNPRSVLDDHASIIRAALAKPDVFD